MLRAKALEAKAATIRDQIEISFGQAKRFIASIDGCTNSGLSELLFSVFLLRG